MTAGTPRIRRLREGRALGLDWSGAQRCDRKIWSAVLEFEPGGVTLVELSNPFAKRRGPADVARQFPEWLDRKQFDVAGFDFCFGLHREHLTQAGLPTSGPSELGSSVRARWSDPTLFRTNLGPERRRLTDQQGRAPFAPTNLRMFRQTYWGLCALADVKNPVPPWKTTRSSFVVEVLPAQVARVIGHEGPYKGKAVANRRRALLECVQGVCDLDIPDRVQSQLVDDREGDALDSVLAAIAAASSLAANFSGVPPGASSSGEGWIFPALLED